MDKFIQRLKRFCSQTHVHNVLVIVSRVVLIAALAAAILKRWG